MLTKLYDHETMLGIGGRLELRLEACAGAARLVALRRHAAAGRSLVRVRHAEAHVLSARPWHAGPGVHHRAGADARGLAAEGEARAHQGLAAVEASLAKRRARLAEDRARRAENAVRL